MAFFDFHVHPTLKCMFSEKDSKTSPWVDIDVTAIPWVLRWCTEFEYILESQANPRQLNAVGADLICIALFVPERGITNSSLVLKQANGTLHSYLNPARLAKINDGTLKPFPDLIDEDLEILTHPEKFGILNKKVIPLTRGVTFNEHDANALYVVFSVEGCHTLSSTTDRNKINKNEVLQNLDILSARIPILSLNITHLEQYDFCNHAYGIQVVSDEAFIPTGNRISADGLDIVKHCFKKKIMIDIKHQSLAARRMLIEDILNRPEFTAIKQPLVSSHVGFTGLSYNDIPDYLDFSTMTGKKYGHIEWGKPKIYGMLDFMTAFNPSSINLYDEDILAVLNSGGIIGLSLDKRILGYSEADSRTASLDELAFEEEYISLSEKNVFLTKPVIGSKMNDGNCITTQEVLQGGYVNPQLSFYHLCHFMSHILHLVKVATENNYDVNSALKQICVGSDFDGFINPVFCCETSLALNTFKKDFVDTFLSYADANRSLVTLPDNFNVHEFADQLFFTNGREFVMGRLTEIYA